MRPLDPPDVPKLQIRPNPPPIASRSRSAFVSPFPVARHTQPNASSTEWAALLTWLRAHTGLQPKKAPVTPPAVSVPASPAAAADVSDDLTERRARKASVPDAELMKAAERAFPDGRVKVPPLRTIQTTLHCGQPASQRVQAHFRTLAGAQ